MQYIIIWSSCRYACANNSHHIHKSRIRVWREVADEEDMGGWTTSELWLIKAEVVCLLRLAEMGGKATRSTWVQNSYPYSALSTVFATRRARDDERVEASYSCLTKMCCQVISCLYRGACSWRQERELTRASGADIKERELDIAGWR